MSDIRKRMEAWLMEEGPCPVNARECRDEILRLRLTDKEREAIKEGADALYGDGYDAESDTLRKLLERLHT